MWLFFGALSMMFVRRQKRISSSLFDQRRRRGESSGIGVAGSVNDGGRRSVPGRGSLSAASNGGPMPEESRRLLSPVPPSQNGGEDAADVTSVSSAGTVASASTTSMLQMV